MSFTMYFYRFYFVKKYEVLFSNGLVVRVIVIYLTGLYLLEPAQTGRPTLAMTIWRDTVLKKVLFPAIFAPVTIKNCSLSIVKSLSTRFSGFSKGWPNWVALITCSDVVIVGNTY